MKKDKTAAEKKEIKKLLVEFKVLFDDVNMYEARYKELTGHHYNLKNLLPNLHLKGDSILTFGVHEGEVIQDVPKQYLLYFWEHNKYKYRIGKMHGAEKHLMGYIDNNREEIEKGVSYR